MVTDTAPFRYPHYHRETDTPDKLDFDRMSRVVAGVRAVLLEVASPKDDEGNRYLFWKTKEELESKIQSKELCGTTAANES